MKQSAKLAVLALAATLILAPAAIRAQQEVSPDIYGDTPPKPQSTEAVHPAGRSAAAPARKAASKARKQSPKKTADRKLPKDASGKATLAQARR